MEFMNDVIYEKILEICGKDEIVSIYNYDDNEKFDVGFILAASEEYYIIKNINEEGKYNGYILGEMSNISALGVRENYLYNILVLYDMAKRRHLLKDIEGSNLIVELLNYSKKENYIISLEVNNSGNFDVQGFISSVDEKCIIVDKINDDGKKDGYIYIDTESVNSIRCDTRNERILKKLYTHKQERT